MAKGAGRQRWKKSKTNTKKQKTKKQKQKKGGGGGWEGGERQGEVKNNIYLTNTNNNNQAHLNDTTNRQKSDTTYNII